MTKTFDGFSNTFYPFLNDGCQSPPDPSEGLRFSLLAKARESVEVKSRFFEDNSDLILSASLLLAQAFHRGHKLLVCGNGGSSTDAEHVAVEFMHPITVGRRALPAICLSNDTAMMTAVANDVGFADVFSRQIIALGVQGDILLTISTSGNSENLIQAITTARRMKLLTIGFAGGDGGRMAESRASGEMDFCLTVPTSSIHRIQETHVALYHIMWDMVHALLDQRALVETRAEGESA